MRTHVPDDSRHLVKLVRRRSVTTSPSPSRCRRRTVGACPLGLRTELLGPLPVINHFVARMGLTDSLERFVAHDDARLRLAPAAVLGVVVRNLVTHRQPVYALGEWAAPYDPALLGLGPDDVGALNDDRVGRTLERLFDADRASLLTEVILGVVRAFDIVG